MKQLYSKILYLCLFIFSVGNITAQTTCSSTFTVSTAPTNSTCQANGTITVTLNGDLTNLTGIQYSLATTGGASVVNPQNNNVLTNIPSGNYVVTVRALCLIDANYSVTKTANVTVGGNYKVPSTTFNATTSRKSYDICNTGIIVLNVTDGSGTFTFNITSAPAGATTGVVVPVKSGTTYTLPGENYPAGNYTVQIQDGCYTSVATFALGQITGFPPPYYTSPTGFYPILTDGVCDKFKFYASSVTTTNADYYRYYQDGMYEIGAAAAGNQPNSWTPWISANLVSGQLILDIAPWSYSDFYTSNSLEIYTRLKGCPTGATSFKSYFYNPIFSGSNYISRDCNNYVYRVVPYSVGYYNMICYPARVSVTKSVGGAVVYSNPSWSYNSAGIPVTLDYDTSYLITITGSNGKVISTTLNTNRDIVFTTNLTACNTYQLQYYAPTTSTCLPVNVTIKNASGIVVCTDVITNAGIVMQSCPLNYGQTYTFTAVYANGYTYTTTKTLASTLPATVNFSRNNSNNCAEDSGYFYTSVSSLTPWPAGTKFTITGPAGYTTQTYTSPTSTYYYYWGSTNVSIPAGEYTLTTDYGCGTPVITKLTQNGVYSGKAFNYTTENTCGGMKVTPTGSMTYQGAPITTYYRITGAVGPTGGAISYDKTVITTGGSFTLSVSGTYTLGILNTNSATGCVINSKTIVYTAAPLSLDNTGTTAYTCVDDVTGIIILKAQNGVAPYTYQLWDAANTTKLVATDLVSSGQVHFNYGAPEQTYTARILDACGNSFSQQVTLAKLSTARIVNADPANVCTGESIVLKCTTLGNTVYNWTGPNGYASTSQNPTIPNATVSMSGWYRVSVLPQFCGAAVKDSAYVTVYPPLAAGSVGTSQAVCVRTAASAISGAVTGGNGTYTYQWQSSVDGVTGWTNISGATAATYLPPIKIQSGPSYYRVVVTDKCGTINSNLITVNSTACYIPVNPSIRARGSI